MGENVAVSGARGESFADVARRVGTINGVVVDAEDTDAEVLTKLSDAAGVNADTLAARDEAVEAASDATNVGYLSMRRLAGPKLRLDTEGAYFINSSIGTDGVTITAPGTTLLGRTDYIPVGPDGVAFNHRYYPGNNPGIFWYDEDFLFIENNKRGFTATTVNASAVVNVTAIAAPSGAANGTLNVGNPIAGAGIPADSYIEVVPAGGPGSLGNYTISQNATASAAGVAMTAAGVLRGVLNAPPAGAAYARSNMDFAEGYPAGVVTWFDDHIAVDVAFDDDLTAAFSGALAINENASDFPFMGQGLAILGHSIPEVRKKFSVNAFEYGDNDAHTAEMGTYAHLLEKLTRTHGVIFGAVGGRQFHEILEARAVPVTGTSPDTTLWRGPTVAYVEADFADVGVCVVDAIHNSLGFWQGTDAAFGQSPWLAAPRALGTINDTVEGTFYGDMYEKLMWLRDANPAMRVVVVGAIPDFQRTIDLDGDPINTNGVRLSGFNDAARAFCKRYGFPFIDPWGAGIFTRQNSYGGWVASTERLMFDNLHSNIFGTRKLIRFIAKQINELE